MGKNLRDDLIQLFSASTSATGRTKGRFEMAQLTDSAELCTRPSHTGLKWKLMHGAEQHSVFGGELVKTFSLRAMQSHRLFNENMNPAGERGRGYREMST